MRRLGLILGIVVVVLSGWWMVGVVSAETTARTWYVSNSGTDPTPPFIPTNACNVLQPCQTIGFANSQVSNGDTIALMGGSYAETIFIEDDITLQGVFAVGANWLNCFTACATINVGASAPAISGIDRSLTVNAVRFDGSGVTDAQKAIDLTSSTLSLNNVVVRNIDAEFGGTITLGAGSTSDGDSLYISRSSFINNSHRSTAGTLLVQNVDTIQIENSTFTDNSVVSGLGGVGYFAAFASLTISNTTFLSNTSTANGGALYLFGGDEAMVIASTFENQVGSAGGAILGDTINSFTIDRTTFDNNEAVSAGGALLLRDVSSVIASSTTFSNSAALQTGAIWLRDGTLTLTNTVFANNTSLDRNDDDYQGGGAIFVDDGHLEMTNSVVRDNESESFGGAVLLHDSSATIANSQLLNNQSDDDGGAIYSFLTPNASRADLPVIIQDSTFTGNDAQFGGGGAIYASIVEATDSTFDSNDGRDCGAILATNRLELNRTLIEENRSLTEGGGLCLWGDDEMWQLEINESVIQRNEARFSSSGGIYARATMSATGQFVTINRTLITDNLAQDDNAAVYLRADGATVDIVNTEITNNHVTTGTVGGIELRLGTGVANLFNVTIANNSGLTSGYGLDVVNGNVQLANTVIAGNVATDSGDQTDCNGTLNSLGYNVIGVLDCTLTGDLTGVSTGMSFSPLAAGLVESATPGVLQPGFGSILLDAGTTGGCKAATGSTFTVTADYFGNPRGASACDIGAVELQSPPSPTAVSISNQSSTIQRSSPATAVMLVLLTIVARTCLPAQRSDRFSSTR